MQGRRRYREKGETTPSTLPTQSLPHMNEAAITPVPPSRTCSCCAAIAGSSAAGNMPIGISLALGGGDPVRPLVGGKLI